MSTIHILGQPKTVGELKRLIENYNDDTPFGFRNQPTPELVEEKIGYLIYVRFEEPVVSVEVCSCSIPKKTICGNFCHRCNKYTDKTHKHNTDKI